MVDRKLPRRRSQLIAHAEEAADGAHQLQDQIGLTRNREDRIRGLITAFEAALQELDEAKQACDEGYQWLQQCLAEASQFLLDAASALRTVLGRKPSPPWAMAGWTDHSLRTPEVEDEVLPHLTKLEHFLTTHAHLEISDIEANLTAENCAALHQSLVDARRGDSTRNEGDPERVIGVNRLQAELEHATSACEAAELALRECLLSLGNELDEVLRDLMSQHYITLGFQRPGDKDPPDAPADTHVTAMGGGQVHIRCSPAHGADHYVFRVRFVGADKKFQDAGEAKQPDCIVDGLTAGWEIEVEIVAVNKAGVRGLAGDSATVVVA